MTMTGIILKRWRYLLGKIGWAVFTILFVLILNFFLFRVLVTRRGRASTIRA